MLKQTNKRYLTHGYAQPPSGGCVLKQLAIFAFDFFQKQPPSGGCVLKLERLGIGYVEIEAAAFGRLCVETKLKPATWGRLFAAAFGRLCVETNYFP